ncbi:Protein of unknown function [Micromonospora lupini str. Lupac 08]|uniref:Uncharacterized protein n=1 Tax=Micromonospora lupini str. Lupac 08 TaxID=1150864 RepID=I0KWR8_9ACTN|nr:Protein of unknown function [Micromonospora lupini str. Lupac 08]
MRVDASVGHRHNDSVTFADHLRLGNLQECEVPLIASDWLDIGLCWSSDDGA